MQSICLDKSGLSAVPVNEKRCSHVEKTLAAFIQVVQLPIDLGLHYLYRINVYTEHGSALWGNTDFSYYYQKTAYMYTNSIK